MTSKSSLAKILRESRGALIFVFSISGVVNLLALTGAVYMLQIYDRALTSQSIPTLVVLSVLAIGLYLFQGILDVIRSQILVRLGAKLDHRLAPLAHKITIDMPRYGFSTTEAIERGRDVDTLRNFLAGQGPLALFDLPWMPLYLTFVYLLHPWLGAIVFAGAILLASLTLLTEIQTRQISTDTHLASIKRMSIADANANSADVLKAMGFAGRAARRFEEANAEHLALQTRANDVGGTFSGVSKVLRMMLQSAVLGLGAYLTINGELTAGAIIASSVAAARALAPVDMVISQWKGVVAARKSYARLGETLASIPDEALEVNLPQPEKTLKLEGITVAAPSTGSVILSDISFELKAGQVLGLIGPSGGGKSSLAKAITGVWPLVRGSVRLDDAELDQWSGDDLGEHMGYLPQDVTLLGGTVAENICRFDPEPDGAVIIEAAKAARVHELILRLPEGYKTELGPQGTSLSAGQRQRIALARALYRDPFLVVLDEPNSNLDAEGDVALTEAIEGVAKRKGIAIVIAHRPSALAAADLGGVIQNGRLRAIDAKDDIIKSESQSAPRRSARVNGAHVNGAHVNGAPVNGAHVNGAPVNGAHVNGAHNGAHGVTINGARTGMESSHAYAKSGKKSRRRKTRPAQA
jgi:ATP-binding cassette subfamily C protein